MVVLGLGSSEFASMHLFISWLNALFYMLEITLAIYYLSHFTTQRSLKALIYGILLADTVCMLTVFASTWMLLIYGIENYSLGEARWMAMLSSLMIAVVGVIEEVFLINRCRILAQPTLITVFLLAMVVMHAIFNVYSGLYVIVISGTRGGIDTIPVRYGSRTAAIFASIAGVVDILIPLALSYRLYKVTPKQIAKQRSYLDTLINAISSGGVGGLMSFVLLILFWVRPDVFYFLVLTMGRVYVVTLFVNLLVSKRKASPYDIPESSKVKKLSIGAEIRLMAFSKKSFTSEHHVIDKQLPPTPVPDIEQAVSLTIRIPNPSPF